MIGIDTNVLVRFLVGDDPVQSAQANAAMARLSPGEPGYLTTVVLVETYWVLTRAYCHTPNDVLSTFAEVIETGAVVVQDRDHVLSAIDAARSGADFADALIAAACTARGCTAVLSFDAKAQDRLGFQAPT